MTDPAKTTVAIKGPFPGEAVDRHLKTYGHLPNTKLCDDKGSCLLRQRMKRLFLRWNREDKPYYSITPQAQRAILRLIKKND